MVPIDTMGVDQIPLILPFCDAPAFGTGMIPVRKDLHKPVN